MRQYLCKHYKDIPSYSVPPILCHSPTYNLQIEEPSVFSVLSMAVTNKRPHLPSVSMVMDFPSKLTQLSVLGNVPSITHEYWTDS